MSHTHWAEDSDDFQPFIEGNDLVALNTITSCPNRMLATHIRGGPSDPNWIMFFFVVLGLSKQARVHYDFPLVGIREGGRPYPVCAQVPIDWRPWQRSKGQSPPPQIDRHVIADMMGSGFRVRFGSGVSPLGCA